MTLTARASLFPSDVARLGARLMRTRENRSAACVRALDDVRRFAETAVVTGKRSAPEFRDFEADLHRRLMEVEREIIGQVMAASDIDADAIEIEGVPHRRVLRSTETYMTAAGPVQVERWLYKDRRDPDAHAVAAIERRLGIVEGMWTPRAAEQAAWVVTQLTPGLAEELFERVGNMTPSKSSLDRLPKALSDRWEAEREANEQVLREAIQVPEGTQSIAVSIDGVLAPVDGGAAPTAVRAAAASQGRICKGPAGYREAGCATLSFCDAKGDLLGAIRLARAPEFKKVTLKETLAKDLAHVLAQRPDLKLCKISDAGSDNWEYLDTLPEGPQILDFFHATEHLGAAVAAAYGDSTLETRYTFERLRERLLLEDDGAAAVIRAVARLRTKFPKRERIQQVLTYLRKNRHRMQYAKWKREGFMIGSGVVEAACKTLVAQRLKLSGMRWSPRGAQAILTMRGWDQSERFEQGWALVAATYQAEVHVLAKIVGIASRQDRKNRRR